MGPAVPTMEGIVNFHNHVMIVILFIVLFVAWLMINLINYFNSFTVTKNANFTHSNVLEIIWTSIPALILVVLATPSFTLLYSMDELIDPVINFKIIVINGIGRMSYQTTRCVELNQKIIILNMIVI